MTRETRPFLSFRDKRIEQHPISLPRPTLPGTEVHQLDWPKDDWSKIFVCRHCGVVTRYTAADVSRLEYTIARGIPVSREEGTDYVEQCVSVLCGEEGCGVRVPIHTTNRVRVSTRTLVQESANWHFHNVECPRGHPITAALDLQPCQEDWQQ